jgi:ABC-2 type transport system ATP-binding protein
MQPLVSVAGLTKTYREIIALSDVALTVREGEVLGLIGPNGAGKTTLFECLAGVLPADSGRVSIRGQDVATADRGRHLFYLPDAIAPWPSETVGWAMDFTIGFFGGASRRKHDVVARLGLEPLMHRPVGALSKGQRKRVTLALGLLTPQPVLLADEPSRGSTSGRRVTSGSPFASTPHRDARCFFRSTRSPMRRACAIGSSC